MMPDVAAGPVAEAVQPSLGLVFAAGAVAMVVVGLGWGGRPRTSPSRSREGGHALTASAFGGKVVDIMVAVRGAGFLTCALFMSRNFLTAVRVVAPLAVILAVLRYAGPSASAFFAYSWVWFLLIGGVRSVSELARDRQSARDLSSDAYRLRVMTHLPAGLWVAFFGLFSFAALILGALILARSL